MAAQREVWLRGPIEGVPTLLQPVAHALVQAAEDAAALAAELPDGALWARPGGAASAGFHLQHLDGVLDRMLTYARGDALSEAQFAALHAEGVPDEARTAEALAAAFRQRVEGALGVLRATDPATLTEPRGVGRAEIPQTVLGLLVHAAEHSQRHVGQLLVTVRVASAGPSTR